MKPSTIERRRVAHIADADKGDVGLGGQRQRFADQGLGVQQLALSGVAAMTGSGIGKLRALTASAIVKMTL